MTSSLAAKLSLVPVAAWRFVLTAAALRLGQLALCPRTGGSPARRRRPLIGRSGIGKSEIALDLVERGHRLVADDIATTGEIDEAIRMGFGLRWAQMGLFETSRIAGGEALSETVSLLRGDLLEETELERSGPDGLLDVEELVDAIIDEHVDCIHQVCSTYPVGTVVDEQVVAQSHRVPVLVDYWADWCGPCQMQLPVLLKLVEEHAGRLLLAKVNTDEERGLAREHGIRSLPTVQLFKDGQAVDEFMGALPEPQVCPEPGLFARLGPGAAAHHQPPAGPGALPARRPKAPRGHGRGRRPETSPPRGQGRGGSPRVASRSGRNPATDPR